MNLLFYLIVVTAGNFVNSQTNNTVSSNVAVSSTRSLKRLPNKTALTKTTLTKTIQSSVTAGENVKTPIVSSNINVGEATTISFQKGFVSESSNTVGMSKATASRIMVTKSNYPQVSASIKSAASTEIQSSSMASSSDSVKTGIVHTINAISPVTTRSLSKSSIFVQNTMSSIANSNITLSTERTPTTAVLPSVIPLTTNPISSVAQSSTNAMVTTNVSATTKVTKESTASHSTVKTMIHATTSATGSSISTSDTKNVLSMVPSIPILVASNTTTTLVYNTISTMLHERTASTIRTKATQPVVQNMTVPSSSPANVATTSTTILRNSAISIRPSTSTLPADTIIQSLTSATNASLFSSSVTQTVSVAAKMNMSMISSILSVLPVSDTASVMSTHATNSSIFANASMLSSYSSAIMQTMSPSGKMNATVAIHVTTSPVVSMTSSVKSLSTDTTNSSIFAKATILSSSHSSVVMQTMPPTGKMNTSSVTQVRATPVVNTTSSVETISVTKTLSGSSQSESISQVLANSSMLPVTSVSDTASIIITQVTNSSILAKATMMSSSHSSASVVMQTMSPTGKMNTIVITNVTTSPVVNMTSSIKKLSSSPAISSMAHSSSSQVITPVFPIVLVRIVIDASCNQVSYQSTTFKDAVRESCSKVLNISTSKIKISHVTCGSIKVDVEIQNVNNKKVTQILVDAVKSKQLNISYNGTQFAVTSVKELTTKPKDDDDDINTSLIIYIAFGSILGLAFLIAIVALIVRCRRERSTGMFHLPNEENLELSGFSGRNKSYHGGNFYGDVPDESDPVTNDLAGDTENGGSFGGAYLPAWENLPTMDRSDVSRKDDTNEVNDNLLLTYGKTGGEKGNDSGKAGFVASYDNVGAV